MAGVGLEKHEGVTRSEIRNLFTQGILLTKVRRVNNEDNKDLLKPSFNRTVWVNK